MYTINITYWPALDKAFYFKVITTQVTLNINKLLLNSVLCLQTLQLIGELNESCS